MKFNFHYNEAVVYCKDNSYKKEFDNNWFHDYDKDRIHYYCGHLVHREDRPAIEWNDGTKFWFLNGERHREDGPACEFPSGNRDWWLNNIEYTEEEYWKIINLKDKTKVLDNI
jgi:hypothetical protein